MLMFLVTNYHRKPSGYIKSVTGSVSRHSNSVVVTFDASYEADKIMLWCGVQLSSIGGLTVP